MVLKTVKETETILAALGKRIRHLRRERGFNLLDFANQCNLDETSISNIEAGKVNVSYSTMLRISETLNVDVNDLSNGLPSTSFSIY